MIVLAVDTALDACSVAIARDGETLASISEPMNRGQAERLAASFRALAFALSAMLALARRFARSLTGEAGPLAGSPMPPRTSADAKRSPWVSALPAPDTS